MKKEKAKTPFEIAVDEFFNAAKEVRRAEENFNNASPEFFDIANEELTIAKKNYELAGKKVKMF